MDNKKDSLVKDDTKVFIKYVEDKCKENENKIEEIKEDNSK